MKSKAGSTSGFLSSRTEVALEPFLAYFQSVNKAQEDLWSPENEEGSLIYCIAENSQTVGMIRDKLSSVGNDIPEWCLAYNDMKGISELREALVKYLQQTFMKGVEDLEASQIIVSNGCGSILDNLFYCLAESGDGVIIPAPYYPVFDIDMAIKSGLVPCPAHLDFESPNLVQQLDQQVQDAKEKGIKISIFILTHPHNPLGTLYSENQILTLVQWCCQNKIHLICDEIYANSVFDNRENFQSAAQIVNKYSKQKEAENLTHCKDFLHVVFGFSKDWCASGLRVGCLRTQNETLYRAIEKINYFNSVPVVLQHQLCKVLNDEQFVDNFLKTNVAALKKLYDELTGYLKEVNIPFVDACSGIFIWIDLRSKLTQNTWAAEEELYYTLADKYKIIFTPVRLVADLAIRGVWEPQEEALFDIRILDSDASSYQGSQPSQVVRQAEREKHHKYDNASKKRRATFTPLVATVDGMMGDEMNAFMKKISVKLAEKWQCSYSEVVNWVKTRIQYSIIRATGLCLRGSRKKWRSIGFDDGAGMPRLRGD